MSLRGEILKARLSKLPTDLPSSINKNERYEEDGEEELDDFDVDSLPGTSNTTFKMCAIYSAVLPL